LGRYSIDVKYNKNHNKEDDKDDNDNKFAFGFNKKAKETISYVDVRALFKGYGHITVCCEPLISEWPKKTRFQTSAFHEDIWIQVLYYYLLLLLLLLVLLLLLLFSIIIIYYYYY